MTAAITVRLPFPPSANRLWRNVRGRTIRSAEYDAWLEKASWEVRRVVSMQHDRKGVQGPYGLTILACPPDRRKRDLGNLEKAVSDALAKGGAVQDDSLAQTISLEWAAGEPGVVVTAMETKLRLPIVGDAA